MDVISMIPVTRAHTQSVGFRPPPLPFKMNAKAIFIYLLGLISGVAVFAAAYAVAQWELGFTSSFLGLALFCALCVWVLSDKGLET